MFDLRVKVRGHLDGFDTSGDISTASSALGKFKAKVEKLNGSADLDWIARLGEKGVFSEKVKLEIPFNYDIPLIIGGLPFMVEIGANLLVTPGLTSHHASATGSYHIVFDGSAGITATGTDVKTESSLTGNVESGQRQVTSVGVSAVLVAAQVPRIGFGLGLLNTSAVAFVDHVIAASVVTEGMLGLAPCHRYQINSTFGAGVGVKILGIPVPGMNTKHTLGTPFQKVETEPPGLQLQGEGRMTRAILLPALAAAHLAAVEWRRSGAGRESAAAPAGHHRAVRSRRGLQLRDAQPRSPAGLAVLHHGGLAFAGRDAVHRRADHLAGRTSHTSSSGTAGCPAARRPTARSSTTGSAVTRPTPPTRDTAAARSAWRPSGCTVSSRPRATPRSRSTSRTAAPSRTR